MRHFAIWLFVFCVSSAHATSLEQTFQAVAKDLNAWDVTAADKALAKLARMDQDNPNLRFLLGRSAFLRGEYAEAVDHLAYAAERLNEPWIKSALARYERTLAATRDMKSVMSRRGHFKILFQPGVDEVLVPYADAALEKAYESLGDLFLHKPQQPIRVEIYPRVDVLAEVSPLKASEIRASGTIALCKYNRLMIVSPRALVYGYPWLDTLAHEYIHLLVTRRSRNTVPIWLHEGIAKFFENRWRTQKNARLAPISEDLLARANKHKKLIRFEAMSPSMAKLPTQEDTALAFAEVFTVVELLYGKGGETAINKLLNNMRDGMSDRNAVAGVAQKTFKRFQREWRMYLNEKRLKQLPVHARNRLLFRGQDAPRDELQDISQSQARQLTYLGDRLLVKGRYKAAAKEFAKALAKVGGPNPTVSAKLALALLRQGRHKQVPIVVGPALKLNPQHVLLYLYRGKAKLAMGNYEGARQDLVEAIRLNPFDPEVHGLLAQAFAKLGNVREAEKERRHHRMVNAQ